MKAKFIALALATLSTTAMADVTLYGIMKAGVETGQVKVIRHNNAGVRTENRKHTLTGIADFGSRIGFKGHENLSNGMNAIWKVESKTTLDGKSAGWGTRQAYIGLETTAGTIRAGKMSTQLDEMGKTDQWEYSNNALGLGMFTRTGEKILSVRYDSPIFAGFSFNAQFSPRDNATTAVRGIGGSNKGYTTGRDDDAGDTSSYYAGLNYENAGFFAQYGFGYKKTAYVANTIAGRKSKSGQVHRIEAGYDANNLMVSGGYQYANGWDSENSYLAKLASDDRYQAAGDSSAGLKVHELAVSGAYRIGNVTPKVTYAHGFKAEAKRGHGLNGSRKLASSEYNQVIVGADYDFSKRTTAFAQAGWLRAGKSGRHQDRTETTAGLVGLRHKF